MSGHNPDEISESPLNKSTARQGDFALISDREEKEKDGPHETNGHGQIMSKDRWNNTSHKVNEVIKSAVNVKGVMLSKENSQPEVKVKHPTLLLENQNTNTARLLVNNDSLIEVDLASGGVDTKRPSLLEVTEAMNSSEFGGGVVRGMLVAENRHRL